MKPMLLAVLVLAACGEAPPPTTVQKLPAATVTTTVVSMQPYQPVEVLPGTVRAATSATLMARVQGAVGRISAAPGEAVAAGAVLVEIDALELAAKRDQAKALAAQGAADFSRAKLLFDTQSTTKAEFDAAQARAAGSAAAAAEAEIMLGYTRITAPFAGMVVRRHVALGDLLAPGRPVIDLEDPASLRLEVEIPESLAASVTLGTRLRAQIGAATFDQEVAVVEVTPAADPVSRSVLTKLALPADATGLHSGQFGRVAIPMAGSRLLTVPAGAVVRRGQLDAVFVVRDGTAILRLVRLGGAEGGNVAIRAGLHDGETIVVDGAETLRDGQPVTVR